MSRLIDGLIGAARAIGGHFRFYFLLYCILYCVVIFGYEIIYQLSLPTSG